MEIRQLRYFIAVADTLNFTRAAESVYLSQSSLSRQIMELEKEIGLPLFNRSTRQVTLTEAGRVLQQSAKDLISRWEKIVPEVRRQEPESIRPAVLTIGVDARALEQPARRMKITEMLYDMRRKYPGLRILMRHCEYRDLITGLQEKNLDCAMIMDRELEIRPGLEAENFGSEEMVLAFRSGRARDPEEYAEIIMARGLVLVDREPQGLYHIIHMLSDLGLEPQIRFCEDLRDMTLTVETGESAMILPESVAARLNNPNLQIIHLPTPYARLNMILLWSVECGNPMLQEFRAQLKSKQIM